MTCVLNILHITFWFRIVSMFVILELQTISNISYVDMFIACLRNKFHMLILVILES